MVCALGDQPIVTAGVTSTHRFILSFEDVVVLNKHVRVAFHLESRGQLEQNGCGFVVRTPAQDLSLGSAWIVCNARKLTQANARKLTHLSR